MYGKGFMSILEMILVMIALFIAFSVLFPGFQYKSRWSDTLLLLKSRDIILTADRIDQLYTYSFDSTSLQNFLDTLIPTAETGIISWSEMEGTIKSSVWIACNCTNEQINDVISWFKGLKINRREIDVLPCYTNLEAINPCLSSSDVLLIFGNYSGPVYLNILKEYLKFGSGIVEIADLNATMVVGDEVQEKIFGLGAASVNPNDPSQKKKDNSSYDLFRDEVAIPIKRPINTTVFSYHPWKYFYHIPIPLFAPSIAASVPSDNPPLPPPSCSQISRGTFEIQVNLTEVNGDLAGVPTPYDFWICDSNSVYFDTNLTERADVVLSVGDNFGIVDYYNDSLFWNFTLNYIDGQEKIGVSFKPDYKFSDFITADEEECQCPPGKPGKCPKKGPVGLCRGKKAWAGVGTNMIMPGDGDESRILIQAENKTEADTPIPGVILNSTETTRTAWIANFTVDGVGDDERLLIISLLLWASDKRAVSVLSPGVELGFKTSYVNSVNEDMFEVYRFNLGLGYPF